MSEGLFWVVLGVAGYAVFTGWVLALLSANGRDEDE